ncbi:MAG: tRNA methyl transferase PRC-barrel domain-containing protein [Rickettsiales bacterium]
MYKSSITNLTANTETYINTGTNTDTNIGTDTDTGTNTDTNIGTDTDTSIATITSIGKYQNNQELQQENVNLSYTNSQNKNNKYTKSELHKAIDNTKDQSYFLFNTTQEQLNYLLFPLGSMTKTQTREHAKRLGIRIHNKPDSQDICFVPNGNYIEVIEKYRPDALKEGEIFHIDGFVIGKHLGIHNYTIGQRKGIGIAYEYPLYVIKLDAINNIVYVGPESALHKTVFYIKEVNLLEDIIKDKEYTVKIRSQHPGCLAILTSLANNCIKVELLEKQRAISPGQACVIYDGTRVIGGGWIYLLN